MAAPWFKVYAQELLSDQKVLLLEDDQLGKLLKLWCYAQISGCAIPADPKAIAKLLGVQNKKQMANHLVWIRQFFALAEGDPEHLVSIRLLREQEAYEAKCEKLRANGSKGGRPPKPDGYPEGKPNGKPDENLMGPEVGSRKKEERKRSTLPNGKVTPEADESPAGEVPPSDASQVVLELPCVGKGSKSWPVTAARIAEWVQAFPGVNPELEARKMSLWLKDNPDRRKTSKGMPRFALGWLERAQNGRRGGGGRGGNPSSAPCPNSRAHEADEAFLTQLDEHLRLEEVANA